jgi:SEC-C motif-containing protein
MADCPCGSGLTYEECCDKYISGNEKAPTAEKLMKARYTAYAKEEIDFIGNTNHPSSRDDFDPETAKQWAKRSDWQGIEILSKEEGEEGDTKGTVEFIAHYKDKENDNDFHHHEISKFKKEDDTWYFVDGRVVGFDPIIRDEPKVGRNDPCPCGSGKKHKKCCG